jgi:hypothetical protein
MIAVVETEEFLTDVKGILSEDEHADVPLFLMAIFAKNVQADLATRQRAALTRQLRALKSDWSERKLK